MTIIAAAQTSQQPLPKPAAVPSVLFYTQVLGPTVLPFGPSAGRRGAVVLLADDPWVDDLGANPTESLTLRQAPVNEMVDVLWALNVPSVLFSGEDALRQQLAVNLIADKLMDRAERHNRHLEFELETTAPADTRLVPSLRLNTSHFVIRAEAGVTDFAFAWQLLRTERTTIRLSCRNQDDIAEADRWLLALAAHPDGELTRSEHRIRGRRRWLDVRTWVDLSNNALLPEVLARRWHYSPNLWPLTNGGGANGA